MVDVEVRDRLIADQEALLNVYRCMFGVDVEVVPGGCVGGAPGSPAKDPAPFSGDTTAQDIAVRDNLIANQEALLNVYRCRFRIDMQQVPGGCPEPVNEPDEDTEVVQQGDNHTCVRNTYAWCLLADGSWRVKKKPYIGIQEGSVEVCGPLEVLEDKVWEDIVDCVPYTVIRWQGRTEASSSEHLRIFPHNCGPGWLYDTNLIDQPERILFEPTMTFRGYCGGLMLSWDYRPIEVSFSAYPGFFLCNYRDWAMNRHDEVCLPPDTELNDLNPFQYLALPDNSENRELDRSHDPQVQKPYLNYDLILVKEFCRRYPVAKVCTKILGTQN